MGSILEVYDNDRMLSVFGFGGIPRFMNIHEVSHFFPLNGNLYDPNVFGTQGILATYRQNIPMISLSGPTYFAPLLKGILATID